MSAPYSDNRISRTQAEGIAFEHRQTPILNKLQEFTNLGDKSLIMKTTFLSVVLKYTGKDIFRRLRDIITILPENFKKIGHGFLSIL